MKSNLRAVKWCYKKSTPTHQSGRSLRWTTDRGEVVFKEGGTSLQGEIAWLHALKNDSQLRSEMPVPFQQKNGEPLYSVNHNEQNGIAFHAPSNYYRYLDDPSLRIDQFKQGLLKAAHDLKYLAHHNVYHLTPIGLFHNTENGANRRPDRGRYISLPDLVIQYSSGLGRLDNWPRALTFGNMGLTGLRDFEELATLEEIMKDHDQADNNDTRLAPELQNLRHKPNAKALYRASLLANMDISLALTVGLRMLTDQLPAQEVQTVYNQYHVSHATADDASRWVADLWEKHAQDSSLIDLWKDDSKLRPYAELLLDVFAEGHSALWGVSAEEARVFLAENMDWMKLVRQMAFFMSPAYVPSMNCF